MTVAPPPDPPGIPHLCLPDELPISAHGPEIIAAIAASPVVIIAGEPGSGKTTQLPKLCLQAGRGRAGRIGCTQPRRIAAVAMAARLAEELGPAGPRLVGHRVRFSDRTSRDTLIKFMTDGILLAELQGDRELAAYDTIIVDEAHERSLNIDFLLGILKDLLARRPELKVIITSATIDTAKFSRHFNEAPVIEVSGRAYPVEIRYRAPEDAAGDEESPVEQMVAAVGEIIAESPGGDILAFLPTERDIREAVELLTAGGGTGRSHRNRSGPLTVLPLYGRLSPAEQSRVFRPVKGRKVVVATNVAETSITVPGIRYVVDSGLARIAAYNPRARTWKLPVVPVSRASCDQRAGRCGRVGPGICVRLYAEEDYLNRPLYTPPEIVRSNLAEVILRMAALNLGEPAAFPFVDPPSGRAIRDGYQLLGELGAIEEEPGGGRHLTRRGRLMSRLPLDPCISRMIIEATENNALREVCVIAAALSIQDPRIRPTDKEKEADQAHARFAEPGSDFLFYLNLWQTARQVQAETSAGRLRKFCASHYISWLRLREWQDIHEQLLRVLTGERGFTFNETPARPEAIHRSLLSGLLRNIALKKEKNIYQGGGGRQVAIFPGSTLVKQPPAWIMAAELVETSRLYARSVAAIEPEWVEPLAGSLMRYSYSDPHWEKRRGQVVVTQRGSLFGLPVVVGRKVSLARQNPEEARRIFMQSALVEGEIRGDYDFLRHNRKLLQKLREQEERSRRRDLLVDESAIGEFYEKRLPATVCDQAGLNRLLKKRRGDEFLRLSEADLLRREPDRDLPAKFPSLLHWRDTALVLSYRFQPGAEDDGLTVQVPLNLVAHLRPEPFEWLVPGMLEEKIFFLLKNLPKNLRRPLVPIPQTAAELTGALLAEHGNWPEESLYRALSREIYQSYGLRVEGSAWPLAELPEHLRCRFSLLDQRGRELAAGRKLAELARAGQGEVAAPPAAALKELRRRYERPIPGPAALPELPERLPLTDGEGRLQAYLFPGLQLVGEEEEVGPANGGREAGSSRVRLKLYQTAAEGLAATRRGLRHFYGEEFTRQLKMLRKDCRLIRRQWLLYEGLAPPEAMAELEERFFSFILDEILGLSAIQRLPTAAEYAARVAELRESGIYAAGRRLFEQIHELLAQRREVLDTLLRLGGGGLSPAETTPGKGRPAVKGLAAGLAAATGAGIAKGGKAGKAVLPPGLAERLRERLGQLVAADFPTGLRAANLPHLIRYLKALQIRVERAYAVPARDAAKDEQLEPFRRRLAGFVDPAALSLAKRELLAEYRQMLAEYEVSLFAQEVGTAFPVSVKRLEEKWREIEQTPT